MQTFLYVLHFLVCFILIGVVLLQRGKGQDLGASLGGGGANTIFGSRGAGNFLTKITTASAVIFMGTSLSLSYLGYKSSDARLFDESAPFVPEGSTAPKAEAAGLQEIPAATGAAAEDAGAAAGATGDAGGLVEVPSAEAANAAGDAGAPPTGSAAPSPTGAAAPADAPSNAPANTPAASPVEESAGAAVEETKQP